LAIRAHCKASTVVAPPRTLGPHRGLPEHPGVEEAVQLTDDELFDPYEQALLWAESDVGIVITPDEQMHLLAISDRVVTDSVGHSVDTLTGNASVVFSFGATDPSVAVNRMATLNLFTTVGMSARAVPLLHGPVLTTGVDPDGKPIGLSKAQLELLGSGPKPNWWARIILQVRARRSERLRRALPG
jgi:hypothetical protein